MEKVGERCVRSWKRKKKGDTENWKEQCNRLKCDRWLDIRDMCVSVEGKVPGIMVQGSWLVEEIELDSNSASIKQ